MNDFFNAFRRVPAAPKGEDTKMRFSVEPPQVQTTDSGDSGFQQWHDAMRMVARLPGGVPPEFRRKLWLTLAEQYLKAMAVDWDQVELNCFSERITAEDEQLGAQILRDVPRTGCSLFCYGEEAALNQALLKRVLLAYARYNKAVGYCQGFNVLAALLLEVMNRSQSETLKVMIYLIEGVLPEGYYANNLGGLSVDMAVLRDLLRQRLPVLWRHLDTLQWHEADKINGGTARSYEPPLTNVFTMQWFLTLFATCLPKASVLRVWDLIFVEGNEVLLRTALAIWQSLADRILTVSTADDFYSIMGVLAREMLEFGLMEPNKLIQSIVTLGAFPLPGLGQLRDKYRYNITPWNAEGSGGGGSSLGSRNRMRLFYSDDEEADDEESEDVEERKAAVATAFGLATSHVTSVFRSRRITDNFFKHSGNNDKEKLQLDIAALRMQYAKLRERQRQAHVIWTAATSGSSSSSTSTTARNQSTNPVTNLLAGRKPLLARRPSASSQSSGTRLRLPPARIVTTHPSGSKASSAPSTPSADKQLPLTPEVNRALPSLASISTSRSRLVQELLEQNSAILHKLKDRSQSVHSYSAEVQETAESGASDHTATFRHPFPRQMNKTPKDTAVKLGLYHSPQKY